MSLFGNYRNRRMPVDEPEVIQIDSDKEEEEVRYLKTNASNKRKVQSHLLQMAIKMPGSNEHALLFLKEKGPLEAHHHEHTHNTYGGNGNIIVAGANAKITGGIGNKTVSTATTTGGFFKSKGTIMFTGLMRFFFQLFSRDVDAPPTSTKEKDIRVRPDEIHNLVQVVTRKERDDDDDIETVPPTGTATSATVSPGVLSVSQVLKMNKKECLEELQKRGLPLTSKESMSRLRETLIQNFCTSGRSDDTYSC